MRNLHKTLSGTSLEARAGLMFALPAVLHYLVFFLIPSMWALGMSFTNFSFAGATEFVGMKNYVAVIYSKDVHVAFRNTILYILGTLPFGIVLAIVFADRLNRVTRGMAAIRVIYFIPFIVSEVAVGVAWMWMCNPRFGLFNQILMAIGLQPQGWLTDPDQALLTVIIFGLWRYFGFRTLIYLAGLQAIPKELYEAATIDGASGWDCFWKVTLPSLRHITHFMVVQGIIGGLQLFDVVFSMTGGGPMNATTTIVHQIYLQAFEFFRMGIAAAMSFGLFVIVAGITYINFRFFSPEV